MPRVICAALLVVVSLSASASAQTTEINGVVIDDRTERPIAGVLVYVEGHPVFAQTDNAGRFALAVEPGRYTIAASVVGFAVLRADVDASTGAAVPVTFRLSEGAGMFTDRITVTGLLRGDAEAGPGAGTLHGRELELLRGGTLDDPLRALQALPLVTATDDFYSEFAVRGSSFRHVGLTVDAIPTRYLMHTVHGAADGGSIAMVNSDTLGAISLLPGSYGQQTGRALGAQVNLLTREGNRNEFRGRAGLSGTSAAFLAEGPLRAGRGSWLASARKSYLGYLIERIEPDASFVFGFIDAQARATYDLASRHQLSFITLVGRAAFDELADDLDENDRANVNSHAWLTAASWRYTPGPRFATTQRLFTTGVQFDHRSPAGEALDAARVNDMGWRADASYAPAAGWLITFGGDAQRLQSRSLHSRTSSATAARLVREYDRRAGAASVHAQIRVPLGPRAAVASGGRIDYWGATHMTTGSPWLNGALVLSDRITLRGGGGVYKQFATLDQIHGLRAGGEGLKPERATHLDAALEYAVGSVRVTTTAYRRLEKNVLWAPGAEPRRTTRIVGARADAPWRNAIEGRARGIELLVRRDAPAGLTGWAGYAYGRHRLTSVATGEQFWADADQRHTMSLYAAYRISDRTTLSGKFRFGSNYPLQGYLGEPLVTAPVVDGRPEYFELTRERNTLRLPPYARLDVRADRAFNWSGGRLVLFVEVANTLDRLNLRNSRYRVDRSGRVFDAVEPLMPIVPSAGFVLEF